MTSNFYKQGYYRNRRNKECRIIMSNFDENRKVKEEQKEKDKTRKEKLAGYFFNLSQLTYTALVLGGMVLFFQDNKISTMLIAMLFVGCILAYALAKIGNNLLK